MLQGLVLRLVGECARRPWTVIALTLAVTVALGYYAAGHLSLDTEESHMISANLPFRLVEQRMDRAFPQNANLLIAIVDAQTAYQAEAAVDALQARLEPRTDVFTAVRRPSDELFFRKHALLFLSPEALSDLSDRLVAAQPLLGEMARDPSLRGMLDAVDLLLEGAAHGQVNVKDMQPLLTHVDEVAAAVAAGRSPPAGTWQQLFGSLSAMDHPQRTLFTKPKLHYDDLVAGGDAARAIREAAEEAGITSANGMKLRLTGPVALADSNFATVTQGAQLSVPLMGAAVLILLFLAVHSALVVAAIFVCLVVGLVATGAFAALTVHVLNPISVAFAVMFVGIAVDFAIQFVVRYRDEIHRLNVPNDALLSCARLMATPLTVAAVATAVGFLSFLPTDYTGVSQLGLIAGAGMVIALIIDFTLLPAMLALIPPQAEPAPVGLPLATVDRWLARHGRAVLMVAMPAALIGAALLSVVPIDFNPIHLQDPRAEAVSTFEELGRDPDNGAYAVTVLTDSPEAAEAMAKRFDGQPQVLRTMDIYSFIPSRQDETLPIIGDIASVLNPTLNPNRVRPAPGVGELRSALIETAARAEAARLTDTPDLASHLRAAADSDRSALALQTNLIGGVPELLDQLRSVLAVGPVTLESLPGDLRRDWVSPDGVARLQVLPKDDMDNGPARKSFADMVLSITNDAAGMPINVGASGAVIVHAFERAGLTALVAIGLLLWIMLRRVLDAVLVVLPLVMGALYTVIGCVLGSIAINYANIISLPLLLGIGVAFNIYFVINWRNGVAGPLQSATTRAVLFSALTTGAAFGSLAVSPHLGTASMGLLLLLSLGLSVLTTFAVLPAIFAVLGAWKAQR